MAKTNSIRRRDRSYARWLSGNALATVITFQLLFLYSELAGVAFYLQILGIVIAIVWLIISITMIYYRLGRNAPPVTEPAEGLKNNNTG